MKNTYKAFFNFTGILIEIWKIDKIIFLIYFINTLSTPILLYINLIIPKYIILLVNNYSDKSYYLLIIFLLVLDFAINILLTIIQPISEVKKEILNNKIIDAFLKKSIKLNISYFDKKENYNKYILVFNNCIKIYQETLINFFSILSYAFNLIVIIHILKWIHFNLIVLIILVLVLIYSINKKKKILDYQFNKDFIIINKKVNYIYRLFYLDQFISDIRLNNLSKFIFSIKESIVKLSIHKIKDKSTKIKNLNIKILILNSLINIIVIIYLSYSLISHIIWFDLFIPSFNAINKFNSMVINFLEVINNIYLNDLYLKDYIEFMNCKDIEHKSNDCFQFNVDDFECLEFRNVSFKYPNNEYYTLKNVSFKILKGQKVLLVGNNGEGKTTIIKLILRLYEPNCGEIYINGININNIDINSVRKLFSVLLQSYPLYAFSIKENLTFGEDSYKDSDLREILSLLGLNNHIDIMQRNLQTPITCQFDEEGIDFSGGEKQRLGIARVLLRKDTIHIFDEPLSNLDICIATKVIRNIENTNNTTIIISHQTDMINNVDQVLILDKGKIGTLQMNKDYEKSDVVQDNERGIHFP